MHQSRSTFKNSWTSRNNLQICSIISRVDDWKVWSQRTLHDRQMAIEVHNVNTPNWRENKTPARNIFFFVLTLSAANPIWHFYCSKQSPLEHESFVIKPKNQLRRNTSITRDDIHVSCNCCRFQNDVDFFACLNTANSFKLPGLACFKQLARRWTFEQIVSRILEDIIFTRFEHLLT